MKSQTGITIPARAGSSANVSAVGDISVSAIPASRTSAVIGSWRARAASSESSRIAAKTARGAWRTSGARRSHARSTDADPGSARWLTCAALQLREVQRAGQACVRRAVAALPRDVAGECDLRADRDAEVPDPDRVRRHCDLWLALEVAAV